ncbi:MAG: hypothetical protein AAGD32_09185 [Planctomycetota bacterium]
MTELRYGENPHQSARLIAESCDVASVAHATQHHGKQLGYINLLDADAALNVVREWDVPACCIVKHATPCGVGIAPLSGDQRELFAAFLNAHASDPLAAFGGVVALNKPIDIATAEAMAEGQKFLEVIVAPSFDDDALKVLTERWKNVRLLSVGGNVHWPEGGTMSHDIVGGKLVQERDTAGVVESEWKVVSERQPTDDELAALKFNWLAVKHVKSNAVVIGGPHGTFGIGGGQVDRVAASKQAVDKAGERAKGAVAASDAFFPFPDGPQILLDAGVTAIVQPGGSVRDQATIDLCNERGAALVFTGRRHFRH